MNHHKTSFTLHCARFVLIPSPLYVQPHYICALHFLDLALMHIVQLIYQWWVLKPRTKDLKYQFLWSHTCDAIWKFLFRSCVQTVDCLLDHRWVSFGLQGSQLNGIPSSQDEAIDLREYVNTSAITVPEDFSIERAYMIHRSMGLRHLTVVDHLNRVQGIITRKELIGYKLDEAVRRTEHGGDSMDVWRHRILRMSWDTSLYVLLFTWFSVKVQNKFSLWRFVLLLLTVARLASSWNSNCKWFVQLWAVSVLKAPEAKCPL